MTDQEQRDPRVDLSSEESFLLEWLGKEDFSAYGECRGRSLDRLISLGLASVAWAAPREDWSGVSLTDLGRARLAELKAAP